MKIKKQKHPSVSLSLVEIIPTFDSDTLEWVVVGGGDLRRRHRSLIRDASPPRTPSQAAAENVS